MSCEAGAPSKRTVTHCVNENVVTLETPPPGFYQSLPGQAQTRCLGRKRSSRSWPTSVNETPIRPRTFMLASPGELQATRPTNGTFLPNPSMHPSMRVAGDSTRINSVQKPRVDTSIVNDGVVPMVTLKRQRFRTALRTWPTCSSRQLRSEERRVGNERR